MDEDGEWGESTVYDYGFRVYDPGIAKFLSVDPLALDYPMLTPYQFASLSPIANIDVDGLERLHYLESMEKIKEGLLELMNSTDDLIKEYASIQKAEKSNIKIYVQYEKIPGQYFTALGVTADITDKIHYSASLQKWLEHPSTNEDQLTDDQKKGYQIGLDLAERLQINLAEVNQDDEFYLVTINKNLVQAMPIGSEPIGGGLNPFVWDEELVKLGDAFFHEIIAHITDRVVGGTRAADHARYFKFEENVMFYHGAEQIEQYRKDNNSPNPPYAPDSKAADIREKVEHGVEVIKERQE